jgi:adenosylcobinamide-GDP ribazoletransferase
MLTSLVAALRFLTRIPVPGPPTQPAHLSRALGWFPLVGALAGLATAGVHVLGLRLWPAPVAAVVAVACGLMLTGGFHEDGATDAADGLGGGWSPERVLEIMKDSRIGAYGAMALWVLLTFRWAALVALDRRALLALPLAMAWGRWSTVALLRTLPALGQGLAKEVRHELGHGPLLASALLLVLLNLAALALGLHDLWKPAAAAGLTILTWAFYLKRSLGGQSGDLLGAGNQLVEAAVLLTLLAR